jgi:hypothetical protein
MVTASSYTSLSHGRLAQALAVSGGAVPNVPVLIVAATVACAVAYYLVRREKNPVRKIPHGYFDRLWIWPPGSHTRWEAELELMIAGADKTVSFCSETLHEEVAAEGPTEEEIAFCKARVADLDEMFQITKPAIEEAWSAWVRKDMPKDWKDALSLDGLSVPKNGDVNQPWGVTYFCEPAGHYFSIDLREGRASLASVDG